MSLISNIIKLIKGRGLSVSHTVEFTPPPAMRREPNAVCKRPTGPEAYTEIISAFRNEHWQLFIGMLKDAYELGFTLGKTRTGRVWDFRLNTWSDLSDAESKTEEIDSDVKRWKEKGLLTSYPLLADTSFVGSVRRICAQLKIPRVEMLLAVMIFESRLRPDTVNIMSGATGFIQFMPSTARDLKTTTNELHKMTPTCQLDYVCAYLQPYTGRIQTCEDVYMAVFCPVAVGRPLDFVLPYKNKAYLQNKGLDLNADGVITKIEACSFVLKYFKKLTED